MKLKLAAVVVLGAIGAGAVFYAVGGVGANAATTTEFLTAQATIGDVTDEIAATGTIESAARTGVSFGVDAWLIDDDANPPTSTVTYPVTEVLVEVGDTVAEGDALATADTAELERELARAKNELLSAEVTMRAADDELDDASTTAAKRQAKISRYNAINGVDQAEQAVDDIKAQIKDASLTAPIAGLVTEVSISAGADAPAGAAVVIDSATFEVTTDVVESDLVDVKIGQAAEITISAVDAELTGTVTAVAPVAGADSGSGVVSFPVTVTLEAAPAAVRSGMSADVTITIASATDVLTIPSAALDGSEGNHSVRTLGADGTPVRTPVEVGLVTNTLAEITSGLAEGTAVVTGTASDLAGSITGGGAIPGGGGGIVNGGAIPGGGPRFDGGTGGD
jgi:macrolide-specific efflux system membrane fusion protein